jgi:GTPase SAR1 family protein
MSTANILMLGLPSSGKTTFIAALWYHLTSPGSKQLSLDTLAGGDHEYLNKIRDEWAGFSIVTRTQLNDQKNQNILMKLKIQQPESKIILDVPDFSGETFKEQFKNREWSEEFDAKLDKVSGIILFVTTLDRNSMPKFIAQTIELEALLNVNLSNEVSEQSESEELPTVEFSHDFVSTQAKLVDILQLIRNRKKVKAPIKVSLVISAWDKVISLNPENSMSPKLWIQNQFPLLDQYILSNKDLYEVNFFGVSAQGGSYETEEKLNILLNKKFDERIIVQENETISNDITQPILGLIL